MKKSKLIAEELKQPRRWYFLSFASDYAFLGAVIVRAHGELTAIERAAELGIKPGGEVQCTRLNWRDMRKISADLRDRLLSEREVMDRLEGTRV